MKIFRRTVRKTTLYAVIGVVLLGIIIPLVSIFFSSRASAVALTLASGASETPQTTSSTTFVASDTSIASASLPAGTYLVMWGAMAHNDSISDATFVHLVRGSTEIAMSGSDQTTASIGRNTSSYWLGTLSGSESLAIEYKVTTGTNIGTIDSKFIKAIRLDDKLVENRDYFSTGSQEANTDEVTDATTASFTTVKSLTKTFHPTIAQDYIILSSMEISPDSGANECSAQIVVDGKPYSNQFLEGESTIDNYRYVTSDVETIGAGSKTISLQGQSGTAATCDYMRSRIYVFRANIFDQVVENESLAQATSTTTTFVTTATQAYTPNQSEDVIALASYMTSMTSNIGYVQSRIRNTTDAVSYAANMQYSGNNTGIGEQYSSMSAASINMSTAKTFSIQFNRQNANGTARIKDSRLIMWSMTLKPSYVTQASYRWFDNANTATSSDVYTKLSDPATLPGATGYGTSFSPDGQYMSVATGGTPFVTIYKRSGDTFTKLSNPASLPTGASVMTAWSSDSRYMTVASDTTPFITIYKRAGDTFTKLSDPVTLPPGIATGTAWSPDLNYMTVASDTTPFITIYKRAGDTFTKLSDPATLPPGLAYGTDWSPDGVYMTVASDTTPFITIYKRAGDTFTKLSDPAVLPSGVGFFTDWSPDGVYMTVASDTTPFITIYKRAGDTFTKLSDPATLPPDVGGSTAWSPDGAYIAITSASSPYITIYKASQTADLGSPLVAQNTAVTVNTVTPVRLRQIAEQTSSSSIIGTRFKLQYAERSGTCDTSFSGETYVDLTDSTGSPPVYYYDNTVLSSGAIIASTANDPTTASTMRLQHYNESNNFPITRTALASSEAGMWDFAITSTAAAGGKTYCLRLVNANDLLLGAYNQIPQITFQSTGPTIDQQMRGGQSVINGTKGPFTF